MKSFEDAKYEFIDFMSNFQSPNDSLQFLDWLKEEAIEEFISNTVPEELVVKRKQLNEVALYSRSQVPNFEGINSTENLQAPKNSEEGLNFVNTVHVDSFLYDDADVEELTEEGKIPTHFCKSCGTKDVASAEMITHSMSREDLEFVFEGLLPDLTGKTVLDIGSRLGAVLFGAFIHSDAQTILGIEMNGEHCDLANKTCLRFGMNERIKVIHSELSTKIEVLAQADVIVLNNVFDWFAPIDVQVQLWQMIRQNAKSGSLLVTIPSLDDALRILPQNAGIDLKTWVTPRPPFRPDRVSKNKLDESISSIFLYSVN